MHLIRNKLLILSVFLGFSSAYAVDEVNGLNLNTLKQLDQQLKDNPQAGKAKFFSKTTWQGGMKSATSFTGYEIDGQMKRANERKFTLYGDEMPELGGADSQPGAVEELMYAVGTCIVAAANANAALMGVQLSKIEVSLVSQIDMHGLMGNPNVRPGILDFKTAITIAGNADEATLSKIALSGYKLSPVSDTVQHGVAKAELPKIIIEKK